MLFYLFILEFILSKLQKIMKMKMNVCVCISQNFLMETDLISQLLLIKQTGNTHTYYFWIYIFIYKTTNSKVPQAILFFSSLLHSTYIILVYIFSFSRAWWLTAFSSIDRLARLPVWVWYGMAVSVGWLTGGAHLVISTHHFCKIHSSYH